MYPIDGYNSSTHIIPFDNSPHVNYFIWRLPHSVLLYPHLSIVSIHAILPIKNDTPPLLSSHCKHCKWSMCFSAELEERSIINFSKDRSDMMLVLSYIIATHNQHRNKLIWSRMVSCTQLAQESGIAIPSYWLMDIGISWLC